MLDKRGACCLTIGLGEYGVSEQMCVIKALLKIFWASRSIAKQILGGGINLCPSIHYSALAIRGNKGLFIM